MQNPFHMIDFLNFYNCPGAFIVDGKLLSIMAKPALPKDNYVEMQGIKRRIKTLGYISERLRPLLENPEINKAVKKIEPLKKQLLLYDRLQFACNQLIPFIRKNAGSKKPVKDITTTLPPIPEELSYLQRPIAISDSLAFEIFGNILILGWTFYPITFDPQGEDMIHLAGEQIHFKRGNGRPVEDLAKRLKNYLINRSCTSSDTDNDLIYEYKKRLDPVLQNIQKRRTVLYRDNTYRVTLHRNARLICAQWVPAYVIEAPDRTLRLFESVWIRLDVLPQTPEEVIHVQNLRIPHDYIHMFISQGLLCLGNFEARYRLLCQHPIEEGIISFLDAVRLTLCAGYYEGADQIPLNLEAAFQKPEISQEEARKKNYPIYRYYRT